MEPNHKKAFLLILQVGLLLLVPLQAFAFVTPFGQRVNEAIERGLGWLRQQEGGQGSIGGQPTGLGALCFLEKRASADWNAPTVGYLGMSPEDQQLLQRAARYMINNIDGLDDGNSSTSYSTGSALMALSVYAATGGPDNVGARVGVRQAIANAVRGLQGNQTGTGAWCYEEPSCDDLSTTQFAMAGLSAASLMVDGAGANLPRVTAFLGADKRGDGGHAYRVGGYDSSHAMTASGIWCYRLAGVAAGDQQVQSALGWLDRNYRYDRQTNWWQNSYYYYLWAAAKGLEVSSRPAEGAAGVYSEDIGGLRVPADDGYPEEPQGWYYDFAYHLLEKQAADGHWDPNHGNGSDGNNRYADTAFAILVLERSLGGACFDEDEDELCGSDDNCPDVANPGQEDRDNDGRGDVCDNCPDDPNRDQADTDADGLGDVCDPYECVPKGAETCNGLDDDCDGEIDEGLSGGEEPGERQYCGTDLPGVCAVGVWLCVDGVDGCHPLTGASDEVCDGLDNDCDGRVDEGLRNGCGFCGPLPGETCNGLDDDCNGEVDDGAPCPPGWTCQGGECVGPCSANECPGDQICRNGFCVSLCNSVLCPAGQVCNTATGDCYDPCAALVCDEGELCVGGQCGTCEEVGCPEGRACTAQGCVDNPCAAHECPPGQACRVEHGLPVCFDSCAEMSCGFGHSCVDGQCVEDPCGGIACPDRNQVCVQGRCTDDPCAVIDCPDGQECFAGRCLEDPCDLTRCPPFEACVVRCIAEVCQVLCLPGWIGEGGEGEGEGSEGEGEGEGEGGGGQEGEGENGGEGGEGKADEGSGHVPGDQTADPGCGCSLPGEPAARQTLPLTLALLGLLALRRR